MLIQCFMADAQDSGGQGKKKFSLKVVLPYSEKTLALAIIA